MDDRTPDPPMGRVFLDACVLYPRVARGLVISAAGVGVFEPRWSQRVLDEWRIAALRDGGTGADTTVDQAIHALTHCPGAQESEALPDLELQLSLPDPADRHVVCAAVSGQAETILTFNLKDFPQKRLAAFGLVARHPDAFFWEALSRVPDLMIPVVAAALEGIGGEGTDAHRRMLKRARLPRLAKAWAALAS